MYETMKVPCKMVVAMSIGDTCKRIGCVVSYEGDTGHGIKESLDEYAGYVDDLFHNGASIPLESGLYNFDGLAKIDMMGGSDEPIIFDGIFSKIDT